MAVSDILQGRGQLEIISGGYGREDGNNTFYPEATCPDTIEYIAWDPTYSNWKYLDVDDNGNGSATTYYIYSDSPNNPGRNSQSTQVKVTVRDTWHVEQDDVNNLHIQTTTNVLSISRFKQIGPTSRFSRDIYIYPANRDWLGGQIFEYLNDPEAILDTITVPVDGDHTVYNNFVLGPGQESATSTITYRNLAQGYNNFLFVPSLYLDALRMGLRFKNNLSPDLPTPILVRVDQVEDICENYVDATLTFEPINLGGTQLYIEYRYGSQDWSSSRSVTVPVAKDSPTTVILTGLIPTNHTNSPVTLYFRAKYIPTVTTLNESDWLYEDFVTIYIPAPNMTVPDINTQECNTISKGGYIPNFESEQCYTEYTCADQEDIRNSVLAKNEQYNRNCRIKNGVATAEDLKGGE